jgi:hypothetical protein
VTSDGADDLAVAMSGEDAGAGPGQGAVVLLAGGDSGLHGAGGRAWRQGSDGVAGPAGRHHFGVALAIGRLDNDTYADLVVGSEDPAGGDQLAGAVTYLRGSAAGLSTAGRGGTRLTQTAAAGAPARDAHFGRTLAILPVTGTLGTLLVGAPRWTASAKAPVSGALFELLPAASGPAASGARLWTAASTGVTGAPSAYGYLAAALG